MGTLTPTFLGPGTLIVGPVTWGGTSGNETATLVYDPSIGPVQVIGNVTTNGFLTVETSGVRVGDELELMEATELSSVFNDVEVNNVIDVEECEEIDPEQQHQDGLFSIVVISSPSDSLECQRGGRSKDSFPAGATVGAVCIACCIVVIVIAVLAVLGIWRRRFAI